MEKSVLVVGGGMAGLSAAWVCARAGLDVTLLEQAPAFSEVGAGIQLGPNATRVLHDWGLERELQAVAAFPDDLWVRDAQRGSVLGRLPLGSSMVERYGKPYASVHRADLHAMLLERVQPMVVCQLNQRIEQVEAFADAVRVSTGAGIRLQGHALLGCDGLWSRVRGAVWNDNGPHFSGHLAYRGMVRMSDLPQRLRRNAVTAWLAPGMHGVHYPVRSGQWMNVVAVVEGPLPSDAVMGWDHEAHAERLRASMGAVHGDWAQVLDAVPEWRLWPLLVRDPMRGAHEHARGRVALLGDAAHPMRPYLAQGAAMALEDAWTLGQLLAHRPGHDKAPVDWPDVLERLAQVRWQRNAWVQERALRNGTVFHARGPLRWGRDMAMRLMGARLLDSPSLYSGPVSP